jgi:hypothetical protein
LKQIAAILVLLMFGPVVGAQPKILVNDLFVLASGSWTETHERVVIVCTHLDSKGASAVPVCFLNEASIIDGKPYLDSNAASVTLWNGTDIEASWTLNLDAAGNDGGEAITDPKLTHLNLTLSLDLKNKTVRKTVVATNNGRSVTTISHLAEH